MSQPLKLIDMCAYIEVIFVLKCRPYHRYGTGVSPHHCLIDGHRHHPCNQHNHLIHGAHQHCLLGSRGPRLTWLTAAAKQRPNSVVHSRGPGIIGCQGRLDKNVQRIAFLLSALLEEERK